ncbi:flagellar hook assembly protein FlgD [Caldichromatium japonicum]|uniref:Basal-body rod modification protein FlgD n=1 Tax=Caldichromatium japonicum TaxID=2699430 RepID=A0A6G7VD49_9GAMM|nr:flagellar hook assembly protein FlgD [Caldichromatium japonicum]QIK37979.1 flagellar hook assembly protein FlgD [Caldichromatium japonicum]
MTELSSDYLKSLGLTAYGSGSTTGSTKKSDELGQEDFLKLMITQLTYQDPTNPVKNEDFVAQMAQFSAVTGIQELKSSFESLSQTMLQGQALNAATLVGKKVLVPASKIELGEGQGVSGAIDLKDSANRVKIEIYDANGQLVQTLDLGSLNAGIQDFTWDGKLANGSTAPAGIYEFKVSAQVNGKTQALSANLYGQVRSVSAESSATGLMLDVQGIGSVSFSDVLRVSG